MNSIVTIPVWERYTLSIEEAAAYFRIGENKLRKIVSENNGMDGTLYQKILTEAIHCYQIVGALLVMLGGFGIIKSVCAIKEKHR